MWKSGLNLWTSPICRRIPWYVLLANWPQMGQTCFLPVLAFRDIVDKIQWHLLFNRVLCVICICARARGVNARAVPCRMHVRTYTNTHAYQDVCRVAAALALWTRTAACTVTMALKNKTVQEMLKWLEEENYSQRVREAFEGEKILSMLRQHWIDRSEITFHKWVISFCCTENEIDGRAFLLLEPKDIRLVSLWCHV